MAAFRAWCGEDVTFLAWGFDDITILRENLQLYGIEDNWVSRWYNAQMIFNAQTDGSNAQKALKTAMEIFEIEPSRPAHDALGDAYHTALICARLDLKKGTREYEEALKSHVNGLPNNFPIRRPAPLFIKSSDITIKGKREGITFSEHSFKPFFIYSIAVSERERRSINPPKAMIPVKIMLSLFLLITFFMFCPLRRLFTIENIFYARE
jgi:hypothetical protein